MLLEFCCIWNLSKWFDKVEGGATLIVDATDDNLLETKLREEALRGIMEAMDNHPDVFKEDNQNKGNINEWLLEWANNPYVTTEDDLYVPNDNDPNWENLNDWGLVWKRNKDDMTFGDEDKST